MGGRIAEELVFGVISTGANNDLVGATELARKMVREWGMSDRIGPMAWGSQGQVFLGEDLMHTRDYCDETARVIDEEVETILREQEERCRDVAHRAPQRPRPRRPRRCSSTRRSTAPRCSRLIEIGRTGAPIESVVTRGADETRFSQPSPAAAVAGNGGNGADQPIPRPAIAHAHPGAAESRRRSAISSTARTGDGRTPDGVEPGSRSSASAAHRSAAVGAPMNDARTSPSSSTTRIIGTASMA